MTHTNGNYILFPNLGYFESRLNEYDLTELREEIFDIKQTFSKSLQFNHMLAGNIEKEFSLNASKTKIENVVLPLIAEYNQHSNILNRHNIMSKSLPLYLDTMWVNFQKKYEFNPSHNHEGIVSFVIWLDIPYRQEEEHISSPGKYSNVNSAGYFEFQYTDSLGQINNYKIKSDKSMQNTILLFPSKMMHCVYPFFSSDDYRITVSGNFKLRVD